MGFGHRVGHQQADGYQFHVNHDSFLRSNALLPIKQDFVFQRATGTQDRNFAYFATSYVDFGFNVFYLILSAWPYSPSPLALIDVDTLMSSAPLTLRLSDSSLSLIEM